MQAEQKQPEGCDNEALATTEDLADVREEIKATNGEEEEAAAVHMYVSQSAIWYMLYKGMPPDGATRRSVMGGSMSSLTKPRTRALLLRKRTHSGSRGHYGGNNGSGKAHDDGWSLSRVDLDNKQRTKELRGA